MSTPRLQLVSTLGFLLLLLPMQACRWIVTPEGYQSERRKAIQQGQQYSTSPEERGLPDLSDGASLSSVLSYAFLTNGELEAAYHDWRAALARVPQMGALDDTRFEFRTLFATENIRSFSDAFDTVSLEVTQEFPGIGKRKTRAQQALEEARAAGERFRAAKYRIQRRVTEVYARLWLNEAFGGQNRETTRLWKEANELAVRRYQALTEGASLTDLRKFELEILRAETRQRELEIARSGLVAELNGLLNRPADAAMGETAYPSLSMPKLDEPELFARAAERNAELAAMRQEIAARGAAQTLAELQSRPDFMFGGELGYPLLMNGPWMPTLIAGGSLPLNRQRIRAGIEEAMAARQAAEARYRATQSDTLAQLVMALTGIRDTRRVESDYGERIIPTSEQLLQSEMSTYGSGGGDILQILDSERLHISFREILLQARADRLRFMAQLEEILAEDLK